MIKKILLVNILSLSLISCKQNKIPNDVMSPDSLKGVMWDLLVAGEWKMSDTTSKVRLHLKDSTTAVFNHILQVHQVDKDQFKKTIQYYEEHPDKENDLIDTLLNYNNRQLQYLEKKQSKKDSLIQKKAKDSLALKTPKTPSIKDSNVNKPLDKTLPKEHILLNKK